MVLDKGNVVEFDSPRQLLEDESGYFTSLVNDTGSTTSQHLKQLVFSKKNSDDFLFIENE